MDVSRRSTDAQVASDEPADPPADEPDISAHSTTPDRTVFTESDNGDGWIATDLTVDVRR
jgi:hypothetical protein